jgi:tetratricopeptide (TPR) repeat protein
MKYIAMYGLILVTAVTSGCSSNIFSTHPPERPVRRQVSEAEPVKQPLYKKPDLKVEKAKPEINPVESRLVLARQYIKAEQYEKVPPLLDEINRLDPANQEATDLANQVYYRIGEAFYKNRQYVAARDALNRVSPDFKDTKLLLASVQLVIDQQVDAHYKRGVKYFINEELENAIAEWEKVLVLNPGHLKAAEDIDNARQLLDKIKDINRQSKH